MNGAMDNTENAPAPRHPIAIATWNSASTEQHGRKSMLFRHDMEMGPYRDT